MRSSYAAANYAGIFRGHVLALEPRTVVELGVLDGYSTVAIAQGLKAVREAGGPKGHLDAYDLFERYAFKHGDQAAVRAELVKAGVEEYVTVRQADALTDAVETLYLDGKVQLLHVDLSNTGEILQKIIELWDPKLALGGQLLFEGGSAERDRVEWVTKFHKTPIRPELQSNPTIRAKYRVHTYQAFPSLTVLTKEKL